METDFKMNIQPPAISVIIPLYNKEKVIKNTVNSVLSQTYSDFELVIVDDGSTDKSVQYINEITDNRIRLITQKNAGVSAARNRGVMESGGKWILFLDADDSLFPTCLEVLSKKIVFGMNIGLICGNYYKTKGEFKSIYTKYNREGIIKNKLRSYFLAQFSMRMGCVLLKREILQKHPFDEKLSRFEDMKWILDVLRDDTIVYCTPEVVMEYQLDNTELSHAAANKAQDFTFNMSFHDKSFWEKCCLGRLLYFASFTYPNDKILCEKYKRYNHYAYISNIISKLYKIQKLLWR
ncbi:MAG: glycosyltransferase [Lachnospiraceae bacterium]|nr:glycosyltransferase [Lachnospiraceae bacterium]